MYPSRSFCLLLFLFSLPGPGFAQGNGGAVFIRNEGQWDEVVKYKVPVNGGNIFFENNRITWQLYQLPERHQHAHAPLREKTPETEPAYVRGHVFRVNFEGAQMPEILPDRQRTEYHNYFIGDDPKKWAGGVKLFEAIRYQSLYPGVDLAYYNYGDALKYDFIVQPGARPDVIRLRMEGLDDLAIRNDTLVMSTTMGQIMEMPPVAYQETGAGKMNVPCRFEVRGQTVQFVFPEGYRTDLPLIIDPTLIFSTHTGSTADNWGFTATYDSDGNAYAGGIQWGPGAGYPTTPGAFQLFYGGGQADVAISKFNPTGTNLIYSTYLGGSNHDQPHSLVVNDNDELIVMGRTNSTNFPVQAGSFDITQNGGYDIFVTKFNVTGTGLIGSTYLGGVGDDGVNGSTDFSVFTGTKYNYGDDARGEVIVDDQGFIYVASPTRSVNFPTTPQAAKGFLSGNQDGVLIKLNPNLGALVWSTYFGGGAAEGAYGLKLDDQYQVYFTGGSTGPGLPVSPGAYQPAFGGVTDGFVAKLAANGSTILNCTYIGTNLYDQTFLIELDEDFNVYVTGQTESNGFPVVPPAGQSVYQVPNSKQFIMKFDNNLGLLFSTKFGSSGGQFPNISPTAFLVDRCDNIYVTGWGGITNSNLPGSTTVGMPLTANALKLNTDGSDLYLIVLSRNAQTLVYGSYLGGNNGFGAFSGEHVDGGTCRFDRNGVVYHSICSGCGGSAPFPPTPGVWSPAMASNNCNLALFKLDFNLSGIEADFIPEDNAGQPISQSEGCAPLTVIFDNTSLNGNPATTTYLWDFQDNGATSTQFEPTHTFNTPGTYQVMLIITDPTSCNIADTTFKTITVFPPPAVDAGPDQSVCEGDTLQLNTLSAAVAYAWAGPGQFLTSPLIPSPRVAVAGSGSYTLTISDANGCQARDTLNVTVIPPLATNAGIDQEVCRGGSATLSVNSPTAVRFIWSSDPILSLDTTQTITVTNLDTTTRFFIYTENAIGCPGEDTVTVRVFEVITSSDTVVCPGDSVQLRATNGATFQWTPDNGTLSSVTVGSPFAFPLTTTVYNVVARSQDGCISEKDITVTVLIPPNGVAFSDTTICAGDAASLTATGGNLFLWQPGPGVPVTDPNLVVSPATSTAYRVIVFDEQGCRDTAVVQVNVRALPVVTADPNATICGGDSIQLTASGALTYAWDPDPSLSNAFIANPVATPAASTVYRVIGRDDLGCEESATLAIEVIEKPIARIAGVNRTCLGGSIVLRGSGGQTYLWSTGATSDSIVIDASASGWYWLIARVGECASLPDSQFIDEAFGVPVAEFTPTPDSGFAPMRVNFLNESVNAITYQWFFGRGFPLSTEPSPSIVISDPGDYTVRLIAIAEGGCADTAFYSIFADKVTLYVPNAFSPNGDEANEFFGLGYFGIRSLTVSIYSRWGMKIYESDDKNFRWDGTYLGKDVPEGVYVWVVEGLGENGLTYRQNGTVTLIR